MDKYSISEKATATVVAFLFIDFAALKINYNLHALTIKTY
jgi:hypothetical protein